MQGAFATLSAVLGFPTMQNVALVEDTEPLVAPAGNPDQLVAEAFSKRPEILALEFESESADKLRSAERDQRFPTISALGAIGDTPVRDSRLSSWYGAVGVNLQIPIFNGFLFTAKTHEADLRAQAQAVPSRAALLRPEPLSGSRGDREQRHAASHRL